MEGDRVVLSPSAPALVTAPSTCEAMRCLHLPDRPRTRPLCIPALQQLFLTVVHGFF